MLAETAEAMFALLIDEALWAVERVVLQTWQEFLAVRPADTAGALQAARLDAGEESGRLVELACERVHGALLAPSRGQHRRPREASGSWQPAVVPR